MNTNNNQNVNPTPPNNSRSATMVGGIIILFGAFLLLKNLDLGDLIPSWIFGWQMILIIIGLVIGVNSRFEKKSSVVLIAIGTIFLLKQWIGFSIGKFLIPVIAICIGLYLVNRNRRPVQPEDLTPPDSDPTAPKKPTSDFDWDKRVTDFSDFDDSSQKNYDSKRHAGPQNSTYYAENYLKIDAILGSSKKVILTKNFLGGTLTNILGSTEINLLQADMAQPVVIDVFQLFGSTKIIVPPHWTVSTQVSSILSENDDRRVIITHPFDENKKLFITGTSILGNIAIKNS